ncbi:calcium-binding protein [Xanthomonas euvesicatoria]|nr:calcium-binding protein [Xanthomonas euvesicatoria]
MEFSNIILDYAQLAANIYGSKSSVRSELNTVQLPEGWSQIDEKISQSGFMARAYRNAATGEVVVAYAGTTLEEGQALDDWITGNVPAGVGGFSQQVFEAIEFYLNVLSLPVVDSAKTSFTGHSLGGGLASLMAVYFDKKATVFDQAPFEKSAATSTYDLYLEPLKYAGYTLPQEFKDYDLLHYNERKSNVQQIVVAGEVLSYGTENLFKINDGNPLVLDPEAEDIFGWGGSVAADFAKAVDLHSMTLLAGFMNSEIFLEASKNFKELLPRVFRGAYQNVVPTNRTASTLLELLVQRQIVGEGALDTLAADVAKIVGTELRGTDSLFFVNENGDDKQLNLAAALIDVVLAGLYQQANGRRPQQGFTRLLADVLIRADGYLGFDAETLGDERKRGVDSLSQYVSARTQNLALDTNLLERARWGVQDGAAMHYVGSDFDVRSDVVVALHGNNTIAVGGGDDLVLGGNGDDDISGGSGDDLLYGGAGFDTYRFLTNESLLVSADRIYDSGGDGAVYVDNVAVTAGARLTETTVWDVQEILYQSMRGSHRNDNIIIFYPKDEFIDSGLGNDIVQGLENDDTIYGGAGNDSLSGGAGNDILVGGSGSDILSGGAGNDIYRFGVGSGLDFISNWRTDEPDHDLIELGEGITTENIHLARSGDALVIDIEGYTDRLMVLGHFLTAEQWGSGGPIDALHFADGSIWGQDEILEKLGAPLEPIEVRIGDSSYTNFYDTGGYVIGIQSTARDYNFETAGATWFDLGPSDVHISGGKAGDTYVFGKGYGIQAIQDHGGTDRIILNADLSPSDFTLYKLGDDLQMYVEGQSPLTIVGFFNESGVAAIESMVFANGTVWDSAWLHANAVNPNVTLNGTASSDILRGSIGNDQLIGLDGNDLLEGESGDDLLDGGTGADVMRGGMGSDTYVVDDAGDSIFDNGYNSGLEDFWRTDINTVISSIDYTLGINLQQLILDGTADLNGTGNAESNSLQGNGGANILTGTAVDDYSSNADWMDGGGGNDTLIGAWGDDTLIGGTGNDRMEGGGGDDLYYVDSLGDVIVETEGEAPSIPMAMAMQLSSDATTFSTGMSGAPGIPAMGQHPYRNGDTVAASIDFTLIDELESLILVGNAVNGTGNEFRNWLKGNAQDNVLSGLGGSDTVSGGAGRDVLYGGDGGDDLDGNDGDDTLVGGDGDDLYVYTAGQGHDTIVNIDVYGEDMLQVNGAGFDQFSFARAGDDMVATLNDQSGSLTFKDWYTDTANRVDRLYDQNWTGLNADQVDSLVGGAELSQLIGAMSQGETGQEFYAQAWSERGNQPNVMIAAV